MQDIPKIVRQRLRAPTPAISHPDADVLTAFAERSLPEVERQVVLQHMAGCGDCRDIVALALPEVEAVEIAIHPSPSAWTLPALRWGFVAAGIVAIASFSVVQYQRHSQPSSVASKQSPNIEVAVNEPKKQELARFSGATPPENRDKLQSPAAPAFADSVGGAKVVSDEKQESENEKKSAIRAERSRAQVPAPTTGGGNDSSHGAAVAGSLSHGPRLANQWPQRNLANNTPNARNSNTQSQASAAPPPAAFAKQQTASAVATKDQNLDLTAASQSPSTSADAFTSIARAKAAPMPSGRESATVQPSVDQAVAGLKVKGAPGQLRGNVVDPTGAAVSNARITIIPADKGARATTVTDAAGTWVIAGVPTGSYKAQAEAPGFKTTIVALNYDADQPSMFSLTLNVGSAAETVEVSAGSGLVQTETASAAAGTNREASQTPVNGRSFDLVSARTPVAWSITSGGGLQRSVDHGQTWQMVDVNASPSSFTDSMSVAAASKTSRAAKAKASEKDARNQRIGSITFRAVAAAGSEVWAGGNAGALYHSLDSGNHWTRVAPTSAGTALTGDVINVDFPDAQHGSVSTSTSEVWKTSDAGQSWQKQ